MQTKALRMGKGALLTALMLALFAFVHEASAQRRVEGRLEVDAKRALAARASAPSAEKRKNGYAPFRSKATLVARPPQAKSFDENAGVIDETGARKRRPAHVVRRKTPSSALSSNSGTPDEITYPAILAGTPLSWILHTSQLSLTSTAGTNEQYVDASGDLVADERTTFDSSGGSFDISVGRSGARYEVFSATLNNRPIGALVVALDTNGDYVRDSSTTYDLERDFNLPSAVAVVSGRSKAGREFVIVSSSGDFESEPSAGVVLLVRDNATNGFDNSLSRSLIRVGSNQLNNANALALLPSNDLLIADFDSAELRIVRDTNADGIPDTLDAVPYYSYQFSTDAPIDIAANSRGVVFSHSGGNDTIMLALYDLDADGYADTEEIVVEGLSLDYNLALHGLTVDREGTVYVIENASGAEDLVSLGGNLGWPQIDAFPDPALNGFLRDGALFAEADNGNTQALSGLSFGVETVLPPVAHLMMTNSASLQGNGTKAGLASIRGTGLTRGAQGASPQDAAARAIHVTIEGHSVPVLSFNDMQINIYVPEAVGTGIGSAVVYVNGLVIAADDVRVSNDNPGLFTTAQTGTGEAIALLVSEMLYTRAPFSSKTNNQPTVIALFGTGWRNSLPVSVMIGGKMATVEYAGASGTFNGLDQINVRVPEGLKGAHPVVVKSASGAESRTEVVVSFN